MSLRWRVLPLLMGCVMLVIGLLAWWQLYAESTSVLPWLLGAAVLMLLQWTLFEKALRKPILRLLAGEADHDELRAIRIHIAQLTESLQQREEEVATLRAQRQKAELALREHEQRYMLAVKGANDGLWEWDIASGSMFLSPRWKAMLGFGMDDVKNHIEAWKLQIHPEDRPVTEAALSAAVDSDGARYESQHRVICRDGSYRWITSRGTVMRNAGGKAYRVIGLDTDISQYRRMEEVLHHVTQGTAGATGEAFFRELVRNFAAVIGVRQAFVTECVDFPTTRVRPLATWDGGRFIDDPEYDLAGTPCQEVVCANKSVFYATGVDQHFQCSALSGFISYLGVPIPDNKGRVIGHLVFQGPEPIREELALDSIFKIFVARAAAELERRHAQRVLLEMANGLSQARGEESFKMMARSFAHVTGMREAFVTEVQDHQSGRLRKLAWWRDGEFLAPQEYDLKGSACEETITHGRICYYANGVSRYFSSANEKDWEAYLGVPFFDAQERVIGHFVGADNKPLQRELPDEAVLKLFCERAAVELSRKRLNDTLLGVADSISGMRGEECFRALVKDLCRVLEVREAFICECVDDPATRVRMLARWNRGDYAPCVEFDLAGTTCEATVHDGQPVYVSRNLADRWPLERTYDRDSYLGLPCYDSRKRVIGHIACADGKPMPDNAPEWAILKLFAERAAIELERKQFYAGQQ